MPPASKPRPLRDWELMEKGESSTTSCVPLSVWSGHLCLLLQGALESTVATQSRL